jgi:hypothetical protein
MSVIGARAVPRVIWHASCVPFGRHGEVVAGHTKWACGNPAVVGAVLHGQNAELECHTNTFSGIRMVVPSESGERSYSKHCSDRGAYI